MSPRQARTSHAKPGLDAVDTSGLGSTVGMFGHSATDRPVHRVAFEDRVVRYFGGLVSSQQFAPACRKGKAGVYDLASSSQVSGDVSLGVFASHDQADCSTVSARREPGCGHVAWRHVEF